MKPTEGRDYHVSFVEPSAWDGSQMDDGRAFVTAKFQECFSCKENAMTLRGVEISIPGKVHCGSYHCLCCGNSGIWAAHEGTAITESGGYAADVPCEIVLIHTPMDA